MNKIKKLYIFLYKKTFNFIYRLCTSLKKTDESKIIFVLSRENKLQGNLQFVFFELKRKHPNKNIVFIQAENKMNFKLFKELIHISDAKYLILDDYYLPVYLINPNKQLRIIQLWHAAGAFKKFGYSTVGTKFGPSKEYLSLVPIHSNYTHVYVSSKNVIPYYAEAFNMCPNRIYSLGVPRTDAFSNKSYKNKIINKLRGKFPYLHDDEKVNVLIAPTYRARGDQEESYLSIVDTIIKPTFKINDNIQILYRPHPYTSEQEIKSLRDKSNIHIVDEFTLNDWMLVSDAFVTDYSSAIFDYSLLYKPLAHFIPDVNEYEHNRGFYEDITDISEGTIITNVNSLNSWLNARYKKEHYDTSKMIEYNFDNIKNSTPKIVKHFIEK